jgi:hypothetical protein
MKQTEKRRASRNPIELSAQLSYLAGTWVTAAGEAVTLDLSPLGALMRTNRPLTVGQGITFTLALRDEHNVIIEGRVARVGSQANRKYDLGIAFRDLTAEDEYLLALEVARKTP